MNNKQHILRILDNYDKMLKSQLDTIINVYPQNDESEKLKTKYAQEIDLMKTILSELRGD